jgi:hypothetical protein
MVYIRDEGSQFDASIQTIWRYLQSGEPHAKAHRSARNHTSKTVGDRTMVNDSEWKWNGGWVKASDRYTMLPPLGGVREFVDGPFAGSKMFTVYTPDGERTNVSVFGEFTSPTIPAAEIEKAVLAWLDEIYQEDAPAVHRMQEHPME